MSFIGNIFWFVLGDWLLFIFYTLASIVFSPCLFHYGDSPSIRRGRWEDLWFLNLS